MKTDRIGTANDPVMECVDVDHEHFDPRTGETGEEFDSTRKTTFTFLRHSDGKEFVYTIGKGMDPRAFSVGAMYHVDPSKVKVKKKR